MSSKIDNQHISNVRNSSIIDPSMVKNGFNWGLGAATAGVVVGGAIGAAKAAWIYHTTIVGAETGLAVGGPVGGAIGGLAGAAIGTFV